MTSPSARKQVSHGRTILPKEGPLRLCDVGEARVGLGPYDYLAMPMPYRVPEIILEVPWRSPVDRCVGLTAAP